jgi:hypothetical protein
LARAISARVYYGWFVAIAAGADEFGNAASSITVLTFFVIPMTDEFGVSYWRDGAESNRPTTNFP